MTIEVSSLFFHLTQQKNEAPLRRFFIDATTYYTERPAGELVDASQYAYDATLYGDETFVDTTNNYAGFFSLDLDGTSDYAEAPARYEPPFDTDRFSSFTDFGRTVEGAVYFESDSAGGTMLFTNVSTQISDGVNYAIGLGLSVGSGDADEDVMEFGYMLNTGSWFTVKDTARYEVNTWEYYSGVMFRDHKSGANYDESISLYRNGTLVSSKEIVTWPSVNSGGWHIGAAENIDGHDRRDTFLEGLVDEVRVWNHARTAAEVNSFYQDTINVNSFDDLLLYYTCEDTTSEEIQVDFSKYVTRWPKIKHHWNSFKPNNITISLANESGAFNFLHEDKLSLRKDCTIKFGYYAVDSMSEPELTTLFNGNINNMSFGKGVCKLSITDKWDSLTRLILGSDDEPIDYTTSDYLVGDMAWYLVTSHGGLSADSTTNNPDIDVAAYSDWAEGFETDTVKMQAYFTGQRTTEGLRGIGKQTDSAIYVNESNKLTFERFTIVNTEITSLTNETILDASLNIDEDDMVNKQIVQAGYDVESDYFTITVNDEDIGSVNSFGSVEDIIENDLVWFVDSVSALNAAQRYVLRKSEPYDVVDIQSTLYPVLSQIGDTMNVVDPMTGIAGQFRTLAKEIDLDKGIVKLNGDRTSQFEAFVLDVDSLDGDKILV